MTIDYVDAVTTLATSAIVIKLVLNLEGKIVALEDEVQKIKKQLQEVLVLKTRVRHVEDEIIELKKDIREVREELRNRKCENEKTNS